MTRRRVRLAVLALWLAAGCARSAQPAAQAKAAAEVRDVAVAPVAEEGWERVLHATGELVPAEESTLSTKVAGRLELLSADIGTRVKRGDVVARIEARDFELRVAQAAAAAQAARALLGLEAGAQESSIDPDATAVVREARADLDQARRELERQKTLVTGGAATQSALDAATAGEAAAESRWQAAKETVATRRATLVQRDVELQIAKQQLADTTITAPYDGVVAERLAGTGDSLTIGAPLAHLLRTDPVRLRLVVSEQASGFLKPAQTVRATFDSGTPPLVTQIARFAPALGTGDRTLQVEADVPNSGGELRPGAFARADIVLDPAARTLVVPPNALVRFAGIDKVFVVDKELAVERRIRVGRIEERRVEVLDGVKLGEQVVLDPGKLQGGTRVRVGAKD